MKTQPVKSDERYTIEREHFGHAKPQFVLRFCGNYVASSPFYASLAVRAVGESAKRRGALIFTEMKGTEVTK